MPQRLKVKVGDLVTVWLAKAVPNRICRVAQILGRGTIILEDGTRWSPSGHPAGQDNLYKVGWIAPVREEDIEPCRRAQLIERARMFYLWDELPTPALEAIVSVIKRYRKKG